MEMSAYVVGLERNRGDFSQEAAEFVRSAAMIGDHREEDLGVPDLSENACILEEEPVVLEDTTTMESLKLATVF